MLALSTVTVYRNLNEIDNFATDLLKPTEKWFIIDSYLYTFSNFLFEVGAWVNDCDAVRYPLIGALDTFELTQIHLNANYLYSHNSHLNIIHFDTVWDVFDKDENGFFPQVFLGVQARNTKNPYAFYKGTEFLRID